MLRVGLTGGMGSGKSAVALVWAAEGVPVLHADELGRALMQPGQPVYHRIVEAFGPGVVLPSGELDRAALAREAFANSRLPELNRIVHPAVIAAQERELEVLAATGAHSLAVVESALIFEASGAHAPGWRERFDKLVLVTAPEPLRIERFVRRSNAATEAQNAASPPSFPPPPSVPTATTSSRTTAPLSCSAATPSACLPGCAATRKHSNKRPEQLP